MFQVDEKTVTPLNTVSNSTATTKTIHTDYEFNPFGKIFYYSGTGTVNDNATVSSSYCSFVRSTVDLRYTFNVSTSVNPLSLNYSPVYLKININSTTGMATLNSNLPLTQTLPTTNDGIYYLYLGRSTTTKYTCSLEAHHPIYYHNGTTLCELLPKEILAGIENNSNFVVISDYEDDQFVIATSLNDLDSRLINIESTDFATTNNLTTALNGKVDKEAGKGLSTNDYTDSDKEKLDLINDSVVTSIYEDRSGSELVGYNITVNRIDPLSGEPYERTVRLSDLYTRNGVTYTLQFLTSEQKTQARSNIDAGTYSKPSTGIPASDLESGVIPTVPTISTNIQTDKASDVKTASPKAVYDEVHPAIASAQPQGGFLPNILYNLGTISSNTTFSIATPSDANVVNHYY